MSGDVQPRKRKDKKRKRDDDESSHGVHSTKMAGDDVHLHVHEDHGTGGNWCAKIFFFALTVVLLGVVALIILENRGSADLDTPLSESRFSNYFNGWVDEHRAEDHDEHKVSKRSIEDHDDDHDEHGEPLEEEEDHSEAEDDDHDDDDDHDHEDDDDHDDDDDDHDEENATEENATEENVTEENATEENATEENATEENVTEENVTEEQTTELSNEHDNQNDDDDNATEEQTVELSKEDDNDDDDNDDEDNATEEQTVELSQEDDNNNDDDDDNDDDEDVTQEQTVELTNEDENNDDDEDNDDEDNATVEQTVELTNEDDNDDEDDDDDDSVFIKALPVRAYPQQSEPASKQSKADNDDDDDDDDPFDEDDDDGTFESLESVVDNDAEEQQLLQEKARQQAAEAAKSAPASTDDDDDDDSLDKDAAKEAPRSWTALAVKILIGGILPFVARLVLIRNKQNTNDDEPPPTEINMKRRLTIASEEEAPPEDETEAPMLPEDDEEYSEEEIEIEEEIEYVDEEEEEIEIEADYDSSEMPTVGHYVPETFEQLSAMYRNKEDAADDRHFEELPVRTSFTTPSTSAAARKPTAAAVFNAPPPPPLVQARIQHDAAAIPANSKIEISKSLYSAASPPPAVGAADSASSKPTQRTTHDLDYRPEEEGQLPDEHDIEYEDDDSFEHDDLLGEEEEEDDDDDLIDPDDDEYDVSDVDDADLMIRLEAKYGRLPAQPPQAKEFESDEDPDDPTWTQIKPKQSTGGGGPQANHDDDDEEDDDDFDLFEQELRKANEEMMRENYPAALRAFALLSRKYPDKPEMFLGRAKLYDKLAANQSNNQLLVEALEAYKRYFAFGKLIENDDEFKAAAERCIDRMRFIGWVAQAIPIHEQLIERFSDVAWPRNKLVETYLILNRLSDSILALRETLRRWPYDGMAQVLYGYILKREKDYASAVRYLFFGINSQAEGTQHGRFYFSLGEALQRLGRQPEALIVYERGAAIKLFPSVYQRSLYNEPNLRAQPFWNKNDTTYEYYFNKLERYWEAISEEAVELLGKSGNFHDEKENLRDTGDWKQFELFRRGQPYQRNCLKAPTTCSLLTEFTAATGCRRGQVKFSVLQPGTHIWPHCGPTNCRLRAHLGLKVPRNTRMRVGTEERTWTVGKFLIFDDSFEHEVWHNGRGVRLVLIVDVWHPDLSAEKRQSLTAI